MTYTKRQEELATMHLSGSRGDYLGAQESLYKKYTVKSLRKIAEELKVELKARDTKAQIVVKIGEFLRLFQINNNENILNAEYTEIEQQTPALPATIEQPAQEPEITNNEQSDATDTPLYVKPVKTSTRTRKVKSLLTLESVNACETSGELRDILITAKKSEIIEFVKQFGINIKLYKGLNTVEKIANYCAAKILAIREHKATHTQSPEPVKQYTFKTHTDKKRQIVIDFDSVSTND